MKDLIKRMVEMDYKYKNNHLAASLSALPIIKNIYESMNLAQDVFLLSKGHACYAWYAVLEQYGYDPNWWNHHPDIDPQNGILTSSGSLGHGLPMAVGMALSKKITNYPGIVHVLLGDGECQEGTTWEALNVAQQFNLSNLKVHVDVNGYQGIKETPSKIILNLETIFSKLVIPHRTVRWQGLPMFAGKEAQSVVELSEKDYITIMESL